MDSTGIDALHGASGKPSGQEVTLPSMAAEAEPPR
jgi:hypothetical protein